MSRENYHRYKPFKRRRGWGYSTGHPWTIGSLIAGIVVYAILTLIGLAIR